MPQSNFYIFHNIFKVLIEGLTSIDAQSKYTFTSERCPVIQFSTLSKIAGIFISQLKWPQLQSVISKNKGLIFLARLSRLYYTYPEKSSRVLNKTIQKVHQNSLQLWGDESHQLSSGSWEHGSLRKECPMPSFFVVLSITTVNEPNDVACVMILVSNIISSSHPTIALSFGAIFWQLWYILLLLVSWKKFLAKTSAGLKSWKEQATSFVPIKTLLCL